METEGLDRNQLAVVPISDDVVEWNRRVLLEEIKSEVTNGCVSERILDNLEVMEALERSRGNSIPESMKGVYCMVALECTVKLLVGSGGKPGGNYSEALNRIWQGRIARLESLGTSQLLSDELNQRRHDLNLVFGNADVCTKLCRMNTRNDALLRVCAYLEEASASATGGGGCGSTSTSTSTSTSISMGVGKGNNVNNTNLHDHLQQVEPFLSLNILGKQGSSFSQEIPKDDDEDEGKDKDKCNPTESTDVSASPKTTAKLEEGICHPIPKRKTVSPPTKNETKIRRKNKRWSLHEEQILRTAVQSFGTSWKYILVVHRADFGDRTMVDLKDKWRNMTKNLHH